MSVDAAPVKSSAACLRRQTSKRVRDTVKSSQEARNDLAAHAQVWRLQRSCNDCTACAASAFRQEVGRTAWFSPKRSLRSSARRPQMPVRPRSCRSGEASGEQRRLPQWPRRGQRFCPGQPAGSTGTLLDMMHGGILLDCQGFSRQQSLASAPSTPSLFRRARLRVSFVAALPCAFSLVRHVETVRDSTNEPGWLSKETAASAALTTRAAHEKPTYKTTARFATVVLVPAVPDGRRVRKWLGAQHAIFGDQPDRHRTAAAAAAPCASSSTRKNIGVPSPDAAAAATNAASAPTTPPLQTGTVRAAATPRCRQKPSG